MSLGFSVAELLPRARGGGALRMGLSRIDPAAWLRPESDAHARAAAFDAHPGAVIALPEAAAAEAELARLIGVDGGIGAVGCALWEDVCLLSAEAPFRLIAGAVAFPTDWALGDKIGLPLAAVHRPIHGYAEQLSAGVDHFLATLDPGPICGRANWFVVPTAEWRYRPTDDPATRFAHVTADSAGERLFVRCERQTLRRLPETRAILFTIGVEVARLDTLPADQVDRLAAALDSLPDGEAERRAAPGYAAALTGYARRARLETAA